MAQVPMLVPSLYSASCSSQKYENPLLIMLHLPQQSPLYASKGAKITQPGMAGYELVIEKEWGCFSSFYY